MKSVFLKGMIFLSVIFLADRVIGVTCKKLYEQSNDFTIAKLRYTMNATHEEILVLGSSRAEYHFVSPILKGVTGLNTYNCGFGGSDLLFSKIQLHEALKRYTPRFVVLESSPSSFFIPNAEDTRRMLLPYYKKDTLIYNTLTRKHVFEKVKFVSSIYPYNSTIASLVKGRFKKNTDSLGGYLPVYGAIDTNGLEQHIGKAYASPELPGEPFSWLQDIADMCAKKNITLFIVSSPVYKVNGYHDEMVSRLRRFCEKFEQVYYLDYTRHELTYLKQHLFKDNTHLNAEGARIFTDCFARDFRKMVPPALFAKNTGDTDPAGIQPVRVEAQKAVKK